MNDLAILCMVAVVGLAASAVFWRTYGGCRWTQALTITALPAVLIAAQIVLYVLLT